MRLVTIEEIMLSPQFALGIADTRTGRRYHNGYDLWEVPMPIPAGVAETLKRNSEDKAPDARC